jgi:hypothetical protein
MEMRDLRNNPILVMDGRLYGGLFIDRKEMLWSARAGAEDPGQ